MACDADGAARYGAASVIDDLRVDGSDGDATRARRFDPAGISGDGDVRGNDGAPVNVRCAFMVPVPLATVAMFLALMARPFVPVASIVPSLLVTSTELPAIPTPTPVMTPPVKLLTVAVPPASMATPSAPVASILPAFPVTLMVLAVTPDKSPVMTPHDSDCSRWRC